MGRMNAQNAMQIGNLYRYTQCYQHRIIMLCLRALPMILGCMQRAEEATLLEIVY